MTSVEYQQLVAFLTGQFTEVDRRSNETRQDMLGHFDEVYRRFERLEQEYQAITQALRRIEGR